MSEPTFDYVIAPKSSFDATANAIRAVNGTNSAITWGQDGFASVIEYIYDSMINGSLEIDLISNVTSMVAEGLAHRSSLKSIYMPNLIETKSYCFTEVGAKTIVLPSCLNTVANSCRACPNLEAVDILGGGVNSANQVVGSNAFMNDAKLTILVIRETNPKSRVLYSTNPFNGTPFASDGTGGTLYVPGSQITQYEQATNWSTVLAYTNNQIKSIESTHTDPNAPIDLTLYYVDGTPISGGTT